MSNHEIRELWRNDPTGRTAMQNIIEGGGDDLVIVDIRGTELFRIKPTLLIRLLPLIRFTMTRRGGGVRAHWAANEKDERLEVRPETVIPGAGDQTGMRATSVETRRAVNAPDYVSISSAGSPGLGKRA